MEQDNQTIKASILDLFKLLTNSYVEKSDLVSKQLMEIYSQQEINIIPILFDIYLNHSNISFRKQAAIGIRICIKKCIKQLDEDSIQQIWNEFFQIFTSEPNDELIQLIMIPATELLSQSRKVFDFGFENFGILNFLQSLEEQNFIRCLQILTEFLTESIKFETNFYDFVFHMLQLSYQYPEKYKIIKEIVFISYILMSRKQIEDDIKNEISIHLSQLFVELLNDIDDFKLHLLNQFNPILGYDIQPLKMDIIFQPIFQILLDQNISIKIKYHIAYLFSLTFPLDNTKFDSNDIIQIFKISVYISVMIFDDSDDPSDPESVTMDNLISECLRRLPNDKVQTAVSTTFQCLIDQTNNTEEFDFGSSSLYSKLYTALILIESSINRSVYLFIDFIPKMAEFCVACLDANQPAVQNYATYLLIENITIFKDHLLPTIQEISSSVITKIDSSDFISGYSILSEILDNFSTDICDQLFLPIYTLCAKKIELIEDSSFHNTVFYSLFLMANLFRNASSDVCSPYFDEIFPASIEIVVSFYESQKQKQEQGSPLNEDTDIPSIIIELIGSFSKSCSDKLEAHFDSVTSLLLELLQLQIQSYLSHLTSDLMLCQSLFNCLKMFVNHMPRSISPYVDTFLPTIIENLKSKISENKKEISEDFDTSEMIKSKLESLSGHITVPSIELLESILEKTPEKIPKTEEVISDICVISVHYLESVTKSEVLASINLVIQIIDFFYVLSQNSESQSSEATYLEMTKMYVQIIYEKFNNEIEKSVPYGDYDEFNSWLECIAEVYMKFKINAFEIDVKEQKKCVIFDIFDSLLDVALSTIQNNEDEEENEEGGKLRFIDDLHDNIERVLVIIIKYYQQEDFSVFSQFIPKLLRFFEEENLYFHVFSITILTYIVNKSSIIEGDLVLQLFERSIKSIVDDDPHFSIYFVYFLSNLRFNYSELLIENHEKIVQIIDSTVSALDVSKSECQHLIEYLIALFASIESCLGEESLTDSQRFEWFISKLPLQFSQKFNNQIIFSYLINHFDQFPELKSNVFVLFCHVFVSVNAIGISFLNKDVVQVLFQIIVKSNIMENQEAVLAIFDGDENDAKSFYETIQKLFDLHADSN